MVVLAVGLIIGLSSTGADVVGDVSPSVVVLSGSVGEGEGSLVVDGPPAVSVGDDGPSSGLFVGTMDGEPEGELAPKVEVVGLGGI